MEKVDDLIRLVCRVFYGTATAVVIDALLKLE